MLTQPTVEQLTELRLHALSKAWQDQQADASMAELGFDERLALLVEAEWIDRQNKRLTRALKQAKLRIGSACIEDIDFASERKLSRKTIRELARCRWIEEHQNVVLTGPTGVGKTYLACALAQQACRQGYRVLYRRTSRLFDELRLAHADGTYRRLLARFARMDVVVIDDWGLAPLEDLERRDLLEIMEDRYGLRSTIWTSQLPVEKWHDHMGDPTVADAICDRLLHNAHRIVLQGPSRRKNDKTEN
jgi:DNA replication protein DnaC